MDRLVNTGSLTLAAGLALQADVLRAPMRLGWRGAAPRLAPHGAVLGLVVAAIVAGGFSRPVGGFDIPFRTEAGSLTADARLVLGPRAGEVQVRDTLVRPAFSATTLSPSQPRLAPQSYIVRPGDSLWGIGARFNIGPYSVMWSNGLDEDSVIKPGQELRIPPVQGVVYRVSGEDSLDTIAKQYNVDPAVIIDFNGLKPGELLQPERLLVVPGGSLPIVPREVAPPVALAPRPVARPQIPTLPLQPPATTRPAPAQPVPARPAQPVPQPVRPPAPAPTGRLSWPTRGVITTYFSSWHPGIDIAAAMGTNIGAADGGTVTFAGWNTWGYGNRVVVDHGNGYSTTYNHLSVISVRAGQSVGKGQQIGLMGSTGRSTGSHLHFEILRGGGFINPLGALG
jgi:murein DD-endopeptidase MepM/ murein hydrolase activator NlpD